MTPRSLAAAVILSALLSGAAIASDAARPDAEIDAIANAWAHVNYEIKDPHAEAAEAQKLAVRADAASRQFPGRAEFLALEALALLSEADAKHDLRSLELARTAKHLLERAARIDPNALGPGSIYANLGSLYAQVPGFPLGFGDQGKAKVNFDRALAANPNGLDANYFYADFLYRQGETAKAVNALEKALVAPPRPGRDLADRGRKWEASELLAKIRRKPHDAGGNVARRDGGA